MLDKFEEGKMGFFSVQGHRSPHLEGRPGTHSRVMAEILHYHSSSLTRKASMTFEPLCLTRT